MHPDSPRSSTSNTRNVRFKFNVKFRSGHGSGRVDVTITLMSVSEGNAAIAAAGMLTNPEVWSCVGIERV